MSVLTEDGNYHINKHKDSRSAVYTSGTFGTAEVTLQYLSGDGVFHDLVDGNLSADNQVILEHGAGVKVFATVTNADPSTSVEIVCAGLD